MPEHHLLRLRRTRTLLDPPHVQSPILPVEAAHTPHIITVIRELVPREDVLARVGHGGEVVGGREEMAVLALPAVRAAPAREEEASVEVSGGVGAREAGVAFDGAAGLGFGFAGGGGSVSMSVRGMR